ncbi:MAG: c-type cytochrome [Alphaproteobacteria bacterium]
MPATKHPSPTRRPLMIAGLSATLLLAGAGWWFGVRDAGAGSQIISPGDRALVALGGPLYAKHCASCHGAKLEGQENWQTPLPGGGGLRAPPHDAKGHTWHHPDTLLFAITKNGGASIAPPGFKSNMPGFKGSLSDREIRAVLSYIKSRWPERIRKISKRVNERAMKTR